MKAKKTEKGFTLIELLLAMLIGIVVLISTYNLFTIQSWHFSMQEQKAEMLQNARAGLDLMTREILMAGYNSTGSLAPCIGINNATNTPCVGITSATASMLSFSSDLDGDGNLTADSTNPNENITFDVYTSGGKPALGRTSNGSKQPVVENISALSFTYLDANNSVTTNLALVQKLRVSITAQTAKPNVNQTYPTIVLSSDIVPRNLNN
ncbi:MAG: prepilin-type N-terminal cleavage/methylation domain-containing protein [Syntrophales bacterium]|nr:prepilin-type N-terminal cleavage/methylation domain-containing protein [Syntrophales bacterium]